MKNLCAMFEISVEDFDRAKEFYEKILGIEITEMNVLNTQIGMFPIKEYLNWGCISKCDQHRPSKDGTLIYLNADNDLAGMLEKVKSAGGEILTPKTKLNDQFGFLAVFLDTEGNRIALHSLK
jgi:predicted enzyme related to lactoylglutathione lyase